MHRATTLRARHGHIAAIVGSYGILVAHFWFVCDDAYISFRYARNWALGAGLVFNPGEYPPVEGYSNLLWVMLAGALELVRLPPAAILPWLSAACGGVLLWRLYVVLRGSLGIGEGAALIATLSMAASPAIGVWATSGLATMPQTLLIFLLAERWVLHEGPREEDWAVSAAIAAALCLVRTEGIGWVAVVAAASVVRAWGRPALGSGLRSLGRAVAPALAVWILFTAWRYQYYGTIRPHIALAKVSPGFRAAARGTQYVALFWLTCLTPALSLIPGWFLAKEGPDPRRWQAITMLALAFPTYAVVVGGDFMPFGRLLVPGLPYAALLLGGGIQRLRDRGVTERTTGLLAVGLILAQLAPAADLHLVPRAVRQLAHFRLSDKTYLSEANRWANQKENSIGFIRRGRALAVVAAPTDTVVAAAVGAIGYHSGIEVLDQHGLITAEVGRRPMPTGPLRYSPGHDKHVPPEYFVKYEPRFLYARTVQGKLAAGRMKDTLDQWAINPRVMDRYVPDYYEVDLEGEDRRTFLFVVRLRTGSEDPAALWNAFAARRRDLNAELRAQYATDADDEDADPG